MWIFREGGYASIAFPVIGGGTGGLGEERALEYMLQAFEREPHGTVTLVRYRKPA